LDDESINQILKCKNCKNFFSELFITDTSYSFYCANCSQSSVVDISNIPEVQQKLVLEFKEKLRRGSLEKLNKKVKKGQELVIEEEVPSSLGVFKKDKLIEEKRRLKAEQKKLIKLCKENKIRYQHVEMVRDTIFDYTLRDDYFWDDYCPVEILTSIMQVKLAPEFQKIKRKTVEKMVKKACNVLTKLDVIEEATVRHDIFVCHLLNKGWIARKDAFEQKSDQRKCMEIVGLLRRNNMWIEDIAAALLRDADSIKKSIDMINSLQHEKIIDVRYRERKISGYRIIEDKLSVKEREKRAKWLKFLKKRDEERQLLEEQRKQEMIIQKEKALLKKREDKERLKKLFLKTKIEAEQEKVNEVQEGIDELMREVNRRIADEQQRRRTMQREKWERRVKKLTLIRILRYLYNDALISERELKAVCENLKINPSSKKAKSLINDINLSEAAPQLKIEAFVTAIPNFIELAVRIKKEGFQTIPFAEKRETAKKLLVEYLGGTYKYNPKTDLDRPEPAPNKKRTRKSRSQHPKYKTLDSDFTKKTKPQVGEKESKPSKPQEAPRDRQIAEKEGDDNGSQKIAEFTANLAPLLEKPDEGITMDQLITQTTYKRGEILDFFGSPEVEKNYRITTISKTIKVLIPKKSAIRKIKRTLEQKARIGTVQKDSEEIKLIRLLERIGQVEIPVLIERLNISEEKLIATLKDLERVEAKNFYDINEVERSYDIIKKLK